MDICRGWFDSRPGENDADFAEHFRRDMVECLRERRAIPKERLPCQ